MTLWGDMGGLHAWEDVKVKGGQECVQGEAFTAQAQTVLSVD